MEILNMGDLLPTPYNQIRYFAASEENFFISGMFDSELQGFLIDIDTQAVISIPEASNNLEITSDGNYGMDSNYLYHFSGSTVEHIYELDYEDIHLFRNDQEFVIISGTDVHIRNISDHETVINFQTEYPFCHAVINDSEDILYGTYLNYFQVYELNTGTLLWGKYVAQPQRYHFLGNKIFSNNGLYMEYSP
jgi:hypothetical protein